MPEFRLNNKIYCGSSNQASAISYVNEDGSKTTVQNKIDNISTHWENITLSECTPLAVMTYIREKRCQGDCRTGYYFNVVVNNMDYFSGVMYNDIGYTWWGTIQKRGDSIEANEMYKYFSNGTGADSVAPFKSELPDFNIDVYIHGINSNLSGASRFQYLNTDKNYKYLKYSYNGYIDIKLMGDSTTLYSCSSISASSGINSKTATVDISSYSKIYVTSTATGYTNGTLNLTFTNKIN